MPLAPVLFALALMVGLESQALPVPVDRGPATEKAVAFTVNVVWGTEHVLPIARAFHDRHQKATFMLGGLWAKNHVSEVRSLQAMGMEIGSHGYSHRHVGSLDMAGNLEEIDRAQEAIKGASGTTPTLYAPAYGELSPTVLKAATGRHLTVVMWSIDTIDWRPWHTPDIIRSRVLGRLTPGAFILIHPTDRTAEAIGPLLDALSERGFRATTVSDLLAKGPSSSLKTRPSSRKLDQVEYVAIASRRFL